MMRRIERTVGRYALLAGAVAGWRHPVTAWWPGGSIILAV
jgi:hypothetical protein